MKREFRSHRVHGNMFGVAALPPPPPPPQGMDVMECCMLAAPCEFDDSGNSSGSVHPIGYGCGRGYGARPVPSMCAPRMMAMSIGSGKGMGLGFGKGKGGAKHCDDDNDMYDYECECKPRNHLELGSYDDVPFFAKPECYQVKYSLERLENY